MFCFYAEIIVFGTGRIRTLVHPEGLQGFLCFLLLLPLDVPGADELVLLVGVVVVGSSLLLPGNVRGLEDHSERKAWKDREP